MNIASHADKCLSFIRCDLNSPARAWFPNNATLAPTVTLSRQTGCDAAVVAGELAGLLQARDSADPCHWTVFDRNLVDRVLEEHKLPAEIAKFMPEDRVSAIQDAVEEMLGLHPSSRTLLQKTSETVLHLAELGHAIIIGRAANIITRRLQSVFHVRLVAPLEVRVERLMVRNHLDRKAAGEFVRKSDLARKRFLKDHFSADIDDSLQYDLVINTGRMPHREVAQVIAEAIVHWAAAQ